MILIFLPEFWAENFSIKYSCDSINVGLSD